LALAIHDYKMPKAEDLSVSLKADREKLCI